MRLVEMKCPHCGAMLKTDVDNKQAFCEFCHTRLFIDDEVQHIQYDNAREAGYEFEKGRIQAQREAAYNEQRAREEQFQRQREAAARYARNQQKKGGTCWKVVLWIFFFPIMLTIFIARTDKLKLPAKIALIALLWIVLLGMSAVSESGKISPPVDGNRVTEYEYSQLKTEFTNAGFTNVTGEERKDSDRSQNNRFDVVSVSIGGQKEFSKNDKFAPDIEVIIAYHEYKDETETQETAQEKEQP